MSLKLFVLRVHESSSVNKKSPRKICRPKLSAETNLKVIDQTLRGKIYGLPATFEFMTAAAFEARLCPTWLDEIKKTKLHTYTSPAAGINFLLAAGHFVHRDGMVRP